MKLTFLGSGACFYPVLHNTSAYFVCGDNLILLDCGETVYERLLAREDIGSYRQIYVVITHLHADHVGSLGSLISYCTYIAGKKIVVVYPEDSICILLSLMGIARENYEYRAVLGQAVENLRMVPVSVQHAADMKCFGYEIQYHGWHVYYSGDAADIPADILEKFRSGEIQRLYQDTASGETEHHMYVGKLERLIEPGQRNRISCMHLDSDSRRDLEEKGFDVVQAEPCPRTALDCY